MNYYCYGSPNELCPPKKEPDSFINRTVAFTGTKEIGPEILHIAFREEDAPLLPVFMLRKKWHGNDYREIRMVPIKGFPNSSVPSAEAWYRQVGKSACEQSILEYAIEFCRNHNADVAEAWAQSDYQYVVFTWAYLLKNELQSSSTVPKAYHYNYMVPQSVRELMEERLKPFSNCGKVFVSNQVLPLYEFLHNWREFHNQAKVRFLRNERYIVHKYDTQEYNPGELFVPYYVVPVSFAMRVPFAFLVQSFIDKLEPILNFPVLPEEMADTLAASIGEGMVPATDNRLTTPGSWTEFAQKVTGEALAGITMGDASKEEQQAYADLLAQKMKEQAVAKARAIHEKNEKELAERIKKREAEKAKQAKQEQKAKNADTQPDTKPAEKADAAKPERRGILECLSRIFRK